MDPGRVMTSMGRKCPSLGASPEPASMVMATRLAETVDGSGQLIVTCYSAFIEHVLDVGDVRFEARHGAVCDI